ncbi:hypothetical protein K461DRAFT_225288 [Myriangium duriaei CBS 260.36]|uniref:Alternative oxidase n=1 Tax=Myriangium duriaei CBS 260.36 TaxID=1168546 RepID=A0A9P4J5Z8_9PEZI|nr:hypothetical protein K461DRAFT_225288 [Myriangium duriaei CBS 260.36]
MSSRVGIILTLLLLLSWTLAHIRSTIIKPEPQSALNFTQDAFVEEWLDVHIGNPADGYALDQLCNHRGVKWIPNLVLNIDDANGGIGNVRGNILDFVFYAISHGASILLPSFARRSSSDLSALFDGRTSFDAFFDEQHFVSVLRAACPEFHVFQEDKQTAMTVVGDRMTPRALRTDLVETDSIQASVKTMMDWLAAHNTVMPLQAPSLVHVGRTLWDGPDTASFSPKMRRDFGALLRFRPQIRRLAAIASFNLAQRFRLDMQPSSSYYRNAYFGAHLRTEKDAMNAGWLSGALHANYSAQTDAYLSQAKKAGLTVLYVASGSTEDLQSFGDKARAHRMNVTHKRELLSDMDLQELDTLSWDQQAMVDYEILLRSSQFGGVVKSSFSYNIAIARAAVLEMEGRTVEKPWAEIDPRVLNVEDEMAFKDRASIIWGRDEWHERKIPRGAWP